MIYLQMCRSHFASNLVRSLPGHRPFTVSTSQMDDMQWRMCNASRTILQRVAKEVEVVKSLQGWIDISWHLMTHYQMKVRTMLVQAFNKRPSSLQQYWRSIVQKLTGKYLYNPFEMIHYHQKQMMSD